MPYKLRWYSKDPLTPAKNRGEGFYYGRGHGYLSKYSRSRDKNVISFGAEIDNIGLPRSSSWLHIGDGKIKPHWRRR